MMNTIQNTTNINFAGFATDIEKLDDKDEFKEINQVNAKVYIEKAPKVSLLNEFAILFYDNFLQIVIHNKLTNNEIKVLLVMISKMAYGNQLNITQKLIAKKTAIDKANVSRVYKSFEEKNIIVYDRDGCIYLNPNLVLKGLPHKLDKDIMNKLRDLQAESASEGITNSF